jgi:hypothetical protein
MKSGPSLRDEWRLNEVKNKIMKMVFGCRKGEVTGDWRKSHYEELVTQYCKVA